jgi:hypothetical protein
MPSAHTKLSPASREITPHREREFAAFVLRTLTVCVGQGASVGVILGMGVLHLLDMHATESKTTLFPFAVGLVFSALTTLFTDRLVQKRIASGKIYQS